VASVRATLGRAPSLLVNNAAILRDGLLVHRDPSTRTVRQLPASQWKAVLDTNLSGPYYAAREVAAAMLEDSVRPALIVNISSITSAGNPGQSNYAAAKAGLDALTRTWALELAPHGITVNVVAPGPVKTANFHSIVPEDPAAVAKVEAAIPVKRLGQPDDVARAVLFFAERDAGFVTGQVLYVCGGTSVGTLTL
jgi:3-oxoacyl-[acyl-carrier protein] reductase